MTFNVPKIGRRALLAGGTALLTTAALLRPSFAAAKVIRISTPGSDAEWQSKALVAFKDALDAAMPGAFDVQIHYNGTLFAQGTEIEAMQRGNLEVGMISPQDISALIPEYSVFNISRIGQKNLSLLVDDYRYHVHEVGDDIKLSINQLIQLLILFYE